MVDVVLVTVLVLGLIQVLVGSAIHAATYEEEGKALMVFGSILFGLSLLLIVGVMLGTL